MSVIKSEGSFQSLSRFHNVRLVFPTQRCERLPLLLAHIVFPSTPFFTHILSEPFHQTRKVARIRSSLKRNLLNSIL